MGADELASLAQVTALEAPYVTGGGPSLGPARAALAERWRAGKRDRETALRLAFLDWYSCAEPDFLTGLPDLLSDDTPDDTLFLEVAAHLFGSEELDPEVRFVFGWMLSRFPWCCGGDTPKIEEQGQTLWAEFWSCEVTLDERVFQGRGEYGHYFAHILRSHLAGCPPTGA